jgi:hypothetical protein
VRKESDVKMNHNNLGLERKQIALALREWGEEVGLRAFGATCPMPACGALVVTYEPPVSLNEIAQARGAAWEFVCSECGAEFRAPRADLVFQAVPREWLFSQVCQA